MPDKTRYDEAAITEIFRQAAEAQTQAQNSSDSADGLSLEELLEIGRSAGLSPEHVAQAAARFGRTVEESPPATYLGVEIGVRKTIDLPGPMTDEEWEALVVDARQTFGARGKLQKAGNLREWWNGNLHVMVEPSGGGHQLRMETTKGSAREFMTMAIGFLIMAAVGAGILGISGRASWEAVLMMSLIAAVGLSAGGISVARLPGWKSERFAQFEAMGKRALDRAEPANQTAPVQSAAADPVIELVDEASVDDVSTAGRGRTRA